MEHREEYRTISFLMKLPSGCLRERKTKEYPCRFSKCGERESSVDTVVIFSSISPVSTILSTPPSHYRAAEYCFVKKSMRKINRGRKSAFSCLSVKLFSRSSPPFMHERALLGALSLVIETKISFDGRVK